MRNREHDPDEIDHEIDDEIDDEIDRDDGVGDGDSDGDLALEALYAASCAAFCRGRLALPAETADDDAIRTGRAARLRLHRFKRARVLPRVQKIISTLRALSPASVLDVGTGRGVMLWPLLEAFPGLPVTCVDVRADRVADLEATAAGGVENLRAVCGSIEGVVDAVVGGARGGGAGGGVGGGGGSGGAKVEAQSVDVAIASEVLEHVVDEKAAAQALVRVARRFVIVTVPSLPDDNPEHIRLFTAETLRNTFLEAGALRVNVDGVRGHFFAVVTVGGGLGGGGR